MWNFNPANIGDSFVLENNRREFVCECGKECDNYKAFYRHVSKCVEHLSTWQSDNQFCAKCGKLITEHFGIGRFCSRACSNSHDRTFESRLKTSKTMVMKHQNKIDTDEIDIDFDQYVPIAKELYKNQMIRRKHLRYYTPDLVDGIDFVVCPYCKARMAHIQQKHLDIHDKTKEDLFNEFGSEYQIVSKNSSEKKSTASSELQHKLLAEHRHVGWQSRSNKSYAEQFWQNVLDNNDIGYDDEYVVHKRDLGVDDASNYFLDFLIDGFIDLEIDGKQHGYEERAESDKERDRLLKLHGFVVYRIPWINPNNERNKQKVKDQIEKFLSWYAAMVEDDDIAC